MEKTGSLLTSIIKEYSQISEYVERSTARRAWGNLALLAIKGGTYMKIFKLPYPDINFSAMDSHYATQKKIALLEKNECYLMGRGADYNLLSIEFIHQVKTHELRARVLEILEYLKKELLIKYGGEGLIFKGGFFNFQTARRAWLKQHEHEYSLLKKNRENPDMLL